MKSATVHLLAVMAVCMLSFSAAKFTRMRRIGRYVFVVSDYRDTLAYKDAQVMCRTMNHGQLASIITIEEHVTLRDLVSEEVETPFLLGMKRSAAKKAATKAAKKSSSTSKPKTSSSLLVEFDDKSVSSPKDALYTWQGVNKHLASGGVRHWTKGHVPKKPCVSMNYRGELQSVSCDVKQRYICKLRVDVCPRHKKWRKPVAASPHREEEMAAPRTVSVVYLSRARYDYRTAKQFCALTGGVVFKKPSFDRQGYWYFRPGSLISVKGKAENKFLTKHIRAQTSGASTSYLIGLMRKGNSNLFQWGSKKARATLGPVFSNRLAKQKSKSAHAPTLYQAPWAAGQPDGKDGQQKDTDANCVAIGERSDMSLWTDVDCSRRQRFICEYKCTKMRVA